MDVTPGSSEKEKIKEVIQRMLSGETALHTKTVGHVTLVRKSTLPILLEEVVSHDVHRGVLKHRRTIHAKGHEVQIYERRHLQGR